METHTVEETCLGRRSPSHTLCGQQSSELLKPCPHFSELNAAIDLGNMSVTAQYYSPSELLALPPAPILEEVESKNLDEIKAELSNPLVSCESSTEYQDHSWVPLATNSGSGGPRDT